MHYTHLSKPIFNFSNKHNTKVKGQYTKVKGQYTKVKGQYTKVKGQYAKVKGQYAKVKGYYTSWLSFQVFLNWIFNCHLALQLNVTSSWLQLC